MSDLFNYLTGYSRQTDYRALLVAPLALRDRFTRLVEREIAHAQAGRPAQIIFKNNSIADPGIIRTALSRVARKGCGSTRSCAASVACDRASPA